MSEQFDGAPHFHRLASVVFGQPLLCTVQAAETVGAYLRGRMLGLDAQANRFAGEQQFDERTGRWKGYRAVENVGVISIMGELVNRGAWMGATSGLTSYEGILEQAKQLAADPRLDTALLDIMTPGGEAYGMVDTARQLKAILAGKRIVAVANPIAASAGYGLGVIADTIVVNEGGLLGSIGVVMVGYDESARLEKNGVKVNVITTGRKKTVGLTSQPLTDEGRAVMEERAAAIMSGFVKLVTEFRPGLTAEAIYDMEGGLFLGQQAVEAGLADRVGTFESVLADLTRAAGRTPPQTPKGYRMDGNSGAPAAANAGITQADLDAAVAKAKADARAEASATLKAERDRMAALDQLSAKVGGNAEALAAIAKAKEDGTSPEATAYALAMSGVFAKAAVLGALQGDDATAAAALPAGAADGPAKATTPEGWKAEWEGSDKLQAQYPTAAAYVATRKYEQRKGGVK